MKNKILVAAIATMLSTTVNADTVLGIYIGGSIWQAENSGTFGQTSEQNSFEFDDETNGSFYAALEHPLPFIPNVKISSTNLKAEGEGTLDIAFDGVTGEATTEFDTNYIDYTLYYELFDNDLFSLDFGLTARDIDADIVVASGSEEGDISVSGVIPMLYLATEIGLPATSFNIFANGNFLAVDDNTVHDVQIGIGYELLDNIAVDVDITLGYRSVQLELDDLDDFTSNLEFEGVFLGAVVHF